MWDSGDNAIKSRVLAPGQRCEIWVASMETGSHERIFASGDVLLEAPNWTRDDAALVLTKKGSRMPTES